MTPPLSNPNAGYLARRASDNFATALSANVLAADVTIPLTSVTGLSTDTAVTLVIDPGGANQETIIGWVSSNNIVNCARHVEGATADHADGTLVEAYQTASDHNGLVDFLLTDHNPDGSHKTDVGAPPGTLSPFAGSAAPSGWLVANGASVLEATYPDLFAAIGTTYGSADGTHFNLPDMRGRTPVGYDGTQTEFNAVGKTGGEKTHILTTSEMPSHNHTQNAHSHGVNDPGHGHSISSGIGFGAGAGNAGLGRADLNSPAALWTQFTANGSGTGVSIQATTPTNNATGGDGAHNNLQPYMALNYIIKY